MKIEFQHKDVFYSNPAEGWQNGVYYPRKAKEQLGDTFFRDRLWNLLLRRNNKASSRAFGK